MQYLKILFKTILGIIGAVVFCLVVVLSAENYEIVERDHANVEVKKVFWKKLSECTIDSSGVYDGPAKFWQLLSNQIRSDGQFQDGYWHGRWKEYDNDGQLSMIRVWDKGKLVKLFLLEGSDFIEIQKESWPNHLDITQQKPQRIKE